MKNILKYILIFAICFAGAMLLGRLFKGEDTNPPVNIENNVDTLAQAEKEYYEEMEAKIENEKQYFRPERKEHDRVNYYHKGENEFIKCEYFYNDHDSLLEKPELKTIPGIDDFILKINTYTGGTPSQVNYLFNTWVNYDSLHIEYFPATIRCDYDKLVMEETDWYITISIKNYKKYKGIYLSGSKNDHDSLIWTNE